MEKSKKSDGGDERKVGKINGGDGRDGCRRSTRLVEKHKKADGGDKRRR